MTIIDKNVENIYGTAIQAYFDEHSIELIKLVTSAEEIDKDITNLQDVLVQLKTLGVRRNEPLLVVGNGVLHDVIACAASLYHRNTPYVMLSKVSWPPSTLDYHLAQVVMDSASKTSLARSSSCSGTD